MEITRFFLPFSGEVVIAGGNEMEGGESVTKE